MQRRCLCLILAAGDGTRMKSDKPKVLHNLAGLPLVCHVAQTLVKSGCDTIGVVVGNQGEAIEKALSDAGLSVELFQQQQRLGTAHAVLSARALLEQDFDDIIVAFGDTPLIEVDAIKRLRARLAAGADIAVAGFYTPNPYGYGRLIEEKGQLCAIVEEKDASSEQKDINFCNGGLMAISGKHALKLLSLIKNDNNQQEYYLTDIVKLASQQGLEVKAIEVTHDNILGINNRLELAIAERIYQDRRRESAMLAGVTLLAPESVYFSYDTKIARDVTIEPNVFFGVGVEIGQGAIIRAFSHLEGASVAKNTTIGPYARLRPGAKIEPEARIGNFCEVKNATIKKGAKVNHLTYIGDAEIGAYSNIGAGTITCNYDGTNKMQTIIGENAFIGSNTSLVAPLKIGKGAYVGSGSVVTKDVPADALAVARARQENKLGYAVKLRNTLKK